jgi:hypothetical protein
MFKLNYSFIKLTFLISLTLNYLPCQSQVPFATVAKTPIVNTTATPLKTATIAKTPTVAMTSTIKPSVPSTPMATVKPTIYKTPFPTPVSKYRECVKQVDQILTYCLRNIENTNHAFPDYILIEQQCYSSHESSIKTVCPCYLDSPPEQCFNPKLRNRMKCDSEAKAFEIACRIKTGDKTLCKLAYADRFKACLFLLN